MIWIGKGFSKMAELEELDRENLSVKTVAELLQTNEETVRRWIRDGKLKAEISSKKKGYSISAAQLAEFLNSQGAGSARSSMAQLLLGNMFLPFGALIGSAAAAAVKSVAAAKLKKEKTLPGNTAVSGESLKDFLGREIRETSEEIRELESRMTAVRAKWETYQSVMEKNDALGEADPSPEQRQMSEYLSGQMEALLQSYGGMEQEMLAAGEQLKAYQDSLRALEEIGRGAFDKPENGE